MWYLWAAKFGEYLCFTEHKNWLADPLKFRFYPLSKLEFTEASLLHRMPFLPETRKHITLQPRVRWRQPRLDLTIDTHQVRTWTTPTPSDITAFLWGVEDCDNVPRYGGFVPLGLVLAEQIDPCSRRVPVQADGRLISVEWGDVAFKRAGHRAVINQLQMNRVEELVPGFDPVAVARKLDANPFASTGALADVSRPRTTGHKEMKHG